jgi:hypothetical protein
MALFPVLMNTHTNDVSAIFWARCQTIGRKLRLIFFSTIKRTYFWAKTVQGRYCNQLFRFSRIFGGKKTFCDSKNNDMVYIWNTTKILINSLAPGYLETACRIGLMKLDFGQKVFAQIFTLEFWTNVHPKNCRQICIIKYDIIIWFHVAEARKPNT